MTCIHLSSSYSTKPTLVSGRVLPSVGISIPDVSLTVEGWPSSALLAMSECSFILFRMMSPHSVKNFQLLDPHLLLTPLNPGRTLQTKRTNLVWDLLNPPSQGCSSGLLKAPSHLPASLRRTPTALPPAPPPALPWRTRPPAPSTPPSLQRPALLGSPWRPDCC